MTRIVNTATIRRPPADVFDYVTTPGHWPEWHPSSVQVTGAADHPLDVGEQCAEEYVVAGRRGHVLWTVRERIPERRWVIEGRSREGGHATITYVLAPAGDAATTRYERTLEYAMPSAFLALLDRLLIRRRVARESAEAVRRLAQRLESASMNSVSARA
jgi:uncharacterized protein YndB with AHSA1/START domain